MSVTILRQQKQAQLDHNPPLTLPQHQIYVMAETFVERVLTAVQGAFVTHFFFWLYYSIRGSLDTSITG